jgi:hypothetical protein
MKKTIMFGVAVVLASVMPSGDAQAFGSACRRVDFRVNNNFGDEITVEKFELHSADEGRYLSENFSDRVVGEGVQNYLVRENETVEHGEGDLINYIKITFTHWNDDTGAFHRHTTVDYDAGGTCRADITFTATVD